MLLTRAQRCEQDAGLKVATADNWQRKQLEPVLTFWQGEVKRLRDKLRAMLAGVIDEDDDGPGVAPPSPPRSS